MSSVFGRRAAAAVLVALICIVVVLVALPSDSSSSDAGQPADNAPARASAIMFLRHPAQLAELWIADPDGSNQRQIAPAVSDYSPRPGGGKVVYATQSSRMPSKIEILDIESGQTSVVDWSQDWTSYTPAWSPADGIIVYERRMISPDGVDAPQLWLSKLDGTEIGPLDKGDEPVNYGAVWSPDGAKIGFFDARRAGIAIFNFSDGLQYVPLSGEFDWSPDGGKLVISSLQDVAEGLSHQLVVYDLASGDQISLAAQPDTDDFTPRWSPDGSTIAFVRRSRSQPRGEIWVVPADGSAPPRRISDQGDFENVDPQWSPDGKRLVWTRMTIGAPNVPSAILQSDLSGAPSILIENATQARWVK